MRIKQVWDFVPLPSNLKLVYTRVTLSRTTTAFFLLAFVHCLLQIGLQLWGFSHHRSVKLLYDVVVENPSISSLPPFAILESNGKLALCQGIPRMVGGTDPCNELIVEAPGQIISSTPAKRSFTAVPELDSSGQLLQISLRGSNGVSDPIDTVISAQCASTFPWVHQVLRDATREDLVFVAYHMWLFGVSLVAILNESIPHITAALASELLAASWSVFRLLQLQSFKRDFSRIVTEGACSGIDFLPGYFNERLPIDITVCALNGVVFIAFVGLSWRLIKVYGKQTFERVHGRSDMKRLYIVILTLSIAIQLAAFFMVATWGLFLDQVLTGPVAKMAEHKKIYEGIVIASLILLLPWLILGWMAARKETRRGMLAFLAMSFAYLAAWGATFASQIYRFMFVTWSFFATMSLAAVMMLMATLALGIYSWFHFGLGLREYLKRQDIDPADLLRWSLADPKMDLEAGDSKGNSPAFSDDEKPQVLWYLPPTPETPAPAAILQLPLGRSRGLSESSARSTLTTSTSSTLKQSHQFDRYGPPPPGHMAPPVGLKVIPIIAAPIPPKPVYQAPPVLKITPPTRRATVSESRSDLPDRGLSPPPAPVRQFRPLHATPLHEMDLGSPSDDGVTTPATATAVGATRWQGYNDSSISSMSSNESRVAHVESVATITRPHNVLRRGQAPGGRF